METQTPTHDPQNPVITFPQQPAPKRGMPKWPFAAGGVLLILGIGGFFLMQSGDSAETGDATPTPFVAGLNSLETPMPTEESSTPTPAPSASSAPITDAVRTALAIEVQNGTGTPGDAGVAKKELETLGYKKVTTGNAPDESATSTTITYIKDVPANVVAEITMSLEKVFSSVSAQRGVLTGSASVKIVTGPKKAGAAATPTKTPTATKSPTPSH